MMMMKKSGQIPAFGNWDDYTNDLPITQYFESAAQAGLVRSSNYSGECAGVPRHHHHHHHHIYALHRPNHYRPPPPPTKIPQTKGNKRQSMRLEKKGNKGDYLAEPTRPSKLTEKNNKGGDATRMPRGQQKQNTAKAINAKAVDEDLYKIPPELLHSSKQKKRLGFFSRCLVPTCKV